MKKTLFGLLLGLGLMAGCGDSIEDELGSIKSQVCACQTKDCLDKAEKSMKVLKDKHKDKKKKDLSEQARKLLQEIDDCGEAAEDRIKKAG